MKAACVLGFLSLLGATGACHLGMGVVSCRHGEACPEHESCDVSLGVCRPSDPTLPAEEDPRSPGDPDEDPESKDPKATLCGDSVAEGHEHCDDGNRVSGDGCSSTCRLDDRTAEIEPNDMPEDPGTVAVSTSSVFAGGIDTLYYDTSTGMTFSEYDLFWLNPPAPTVVRIETYDRGDSDDCDGVGDFYVDLHREDVAQVWDAAFLRGAFGNGNGRCAVLTTTLEARPHLVRIQEDNGAALIPSYRAQIVMLDDRGSEHEPNDSLDRVERAALDGLDATMAGTLDGDGDIDLYAVDVPPGRALRAEVIPTSAATSCEGFNARVALVGEDGIERIANASRIDACAFVDGTGVMPQHPEAANAGTDMARMIVAVTTAHPAGSGALPYRVALTVR